MRAGGFDKISPIEAPIDQGLRAADRSDVNRCMSVRPLRVRCAQLLISPYSLQFKSDVTNSP